MRKKYQMTDSQQKAMLDLVRPTAILYSSGGEPPETLQMKINNAWMSLGNELGFDWTTVLPDDADELCFTAEAKQ